MPVDKTVRVRFDGSACVLCENHNTGAGLQVHHAQLIRQPCPSSQSLPQGKSEVVTAHLKGANTDDGMSLHYSKPARIGGHRPVHN